MSFKKKFFKNSSIYTGFGSVSMVLEFISTMIISRFLTPEEYGFVAIITIFSGYFHQYSNTGLSQAVIRSEYGYTFQKLIYNLAVWMGTLLTIIMLSIAYPISVFFEDPKLLIPTLIMGFQFFIGGFTIVPNAILSRNLDFKYIGLLNVILTLFVILSMNIMAILGFSYWALIIPPVTRPLLFFILLESRVKFGIHIYGWKKTKLAFKQVKGLIVNLIIFNTFNYFARNSDNLAIGKMFGKTDLGLYNRAYKFLYMVRKLINSNIGPVLFPSLAEAKRNNEDYKSYFLSIIGVLSFIAMLISTPLILFADELSVLLWGENWIDVGIYLPYIGAIIPMQIMAIAAMDLYILENKEKALVNLGIPLEIILILGIVVGAILGSAVFVARSYAIAFLLVQTPVSLFFGHFRILKFTPAQILKFWTPKIILSAGFIYSIWFGNRFITAGLILLYLIIDVIFYGKDIVKIIMFLKNKFLKKK